MSIIGFGTSEKEINYPRILKDDGGPALLVLVAHEDYYTHFYTQVRQSCIVHPHAHTDTLYY